MSARRIYIDEGPGETRGVVTLDGRPERLLIVRDEDAPEQALGTRVVGRVRALHRAAALAFVDLGAGPDGVLNLTPQMGRVAEGAALEVEIRAEARRERGPSLAFVAPAEGPVRLISPAPPLHQTLARLAGASAGAPVIGRAAREAADVAEAEALEREFPLPGGGRISVEPTRALVAVDVDLGDREGDSSKRAARAANLAALSTAARVLRLKGLAGLVVIDLVGRAHDAPALMSAARGAFSPDSPILGAISRFGALDLSLRRQHRPALDLLVDEAGAAAPRAVASRAARRAQDEAAAQPGARIEILAAPAVAQALAAPLAALAQRQGARFGVTAEAGRTVESFEVRAR